MSKRLVLKLFHFQSKVNNTRATMVSKKVIYKLAMSDTLPIKEFYFVLRTI